MSLLVENPVLNTIPPEAVNGSAPVSPTRNAFDRPTFQLSHSDIITLDTQVLKDYREAITRYPTFTYEQEQAAFRFGLETPAKELLLVPSFLEGIKPDAEKQFKTLITESPTVRDACINANLRLVMKYAQRFHGRGVEMIDLIQEGNRGLIRAVDRFDPNRPVREEEPDQYIKFSSFAKYWVDSAIQYSMVDEGRLLRIPHDMFYSIVKAIQFEEQFVLENHRPPTEREAQEMLLDRGFSDSKVNAMMRVKHFRLTQAPYSLDQPYRSSSDPYSDDGGDSMSDLVPDLDTDVEDEALNTIHKEEILMMVDSLPERMARVIRLRFGLDGEDTHTLEQVGKEFGITRERIRQIESNALRQLRKQKARVGALSLTPTYFYQQSAENAAIRHINENGNHTLDGLQNGNSVHELVEANTEDTQEVFPCVEEYIEKPVAEANPVDQIYQHIFELNSNQELWEQLSEDHQVILDLCFLRKTSPDAVKKRLIRIYDITEDQADQQIIEAVSAFQALVSNLNLDISV